MNAADLHRVASLLRLAMNSGAQPGEVDNAAVKLLHLLRGDGVKLNEVPKILEEALGAEATTSNKTRPHATNVFTSGQYKGASLAAVYAKNPGYIFKQLVVATEQGDIEYRNTLTFFLFGA